MILKKLKELWFNYKTKNKKIITLISTSNREFVGMGREANERLSEIALLLMKKDFNRFVPNGMISFEDAFSDRIITGAFSYRAKCDSEDWPTHAIVTSRSLLDMNKLREHIKQKAKESIWG